MAKQQLQVGENCPDCGTPAIAGKDGGGYCKSCYIKWAKANKPQQQARKTNQPFVTPGEIKKQETDLATGKVRHYFALEAYKLAKPLDVTTATDINKWVNYVMTGRLSNPPVDTASAFNPEDINLD